MPHKRGQRMNKYRSCGTPLTKHWTWKHAFLIPIKAYPTSFWGRSYTAIHSTPAPYNYEKPHPPQAVLLQVILRRKSLSVFLRERAKVKYNDASDVVHAAWSVFVSLVSAPGAFWQLTTDVCHYRYVFRGTNQKRLSVQGVVLCLWALY